MAANGHPAGTSPMPEGAAVVSGGSKQPPVNSAGLVSFPQATPPEAFTADSTKSDSGSGIRPSDEAVAGAAPAVTGKKAVRQRSGRMQPHAPNPGASAGRLNANKNKQGGDGEGGPEGDADQPNALRTILLEAEIRSVKSLNLQLQQQMAFLETQIKAQHRHITGLHHKVKALETELSSAKASAVAAQANPVLPSSTAAAISLATSPVSADSAQLAPSRPPPPVETFLSSSCEKEQPETAVVDSPRIDSNPAPCDLSPGIACGSTAAPAKEATAGPEGNGMTPPGSEPAPLTQPSKDEAPTTVASSPSTNTEELEAPSSGPGPIESSCSGSPAAAVARKAEDGKVGNDVVTGRVFESDYVLDVEVIPNPGGRTPRRRRHSLRDFWNNSSSNNMDDTPPASNTRRHRHRATLKQQQQQAASLPPAVQATDQANRDPAVTPRPSHREPACTNTAEERESTPIADASAVTAATSETGDAATSTQPVIPTDPPLTHPLVLRRAMEGREGAEGRSSHLMDCASCEDALPDGDPTGRCDVCPRSFCARCLERGLREQEVELGGMDVESRALLDGKQGDFFIAKCPECMRGKDQEVSPPPQGTAPMDHLLGELLRHDLSLCFREPVDIAKHPDYVENIGRNAMMDLGTMARKLKERRYPRRRGPGQFLDDLNRIWRNCRRYAGCDELGKPHYGNTVPGIVRCALTLEALTLKYCAAYMAGNKGGASWQESTWDFHRQEQERANATARLKQLEGVVKKEDEAGAEPPSSGGGAGRPDSSPNASALSMTGVQDSDEQDNARPGDESGQGSTDADQQATTPSAATESRKRNAAAMEGVEEGTAVQLGRGRRARILINVTAANSASVGGAPPSAGNPRAERNHQQSPWSPLDRLCDLATMYIQ